MRAPIALTLLACVAVPCLTIHCVRPTISSGRTGISSVSAPVIGFADWSSIVQAHDIGLEGRRKDAPQLLPLLAHRQRKVRMAALWSLARVGSADALPAIRQLEQDADRRVAECARVTAARVKTASGAVPTTDLALRAQMEDVVREAGLSDEAKVQLADMAVVAADSGIAQADRACPADLSSHPMARLKLQLSAYGKADRIRWLVDRLANAATGGCKEERMAQLLIDEGPAATPVILQRLATLPAAGAPNAHVPYTMLFRALQGLGGTEARDAVAAHLKHPNPRVQYYAEQASQVLGSGGRKLRVVDYVRDWCAD